MRARRGEERRRRTYLDLRWARTLLVSTGRPPLQRSRPCISAWLSAPTVEPVGPFRLAIRPCRGACRTLPPGRPPLPWSLSDPSALHLRLTAPLSGPSAWSALLVCSALCSLRLRRAPPLCSAYLLVFRRALFQISCSAVCSACTAALVYVCALLVCCLLCTSAGEELLERRERNVGSRIGNKRGIYVLH